MEILALLWPLFEKEGSKINSTDNACGAVARMILRSPSNVPLDQVLPVILKNLPLTRDYEENEPVYNCIFSLLDGNNTYVRYCSRLLSTIFNYS